MKIYLEKNTKNQIKRVFGTKKNIILSGKPGMDLTEEAEEIACSYLDADTVNHPDLTTIDPEKIIKKEDIEEITQKASYLPVKAQKRVFIIKKAETMTEAAQNALLKVLEDTADRTAFIFITSRPLLNTIRSRCEEINVPGLLPEAFPDFDEVIYAASDGVPEIYSLIEQDQELYEILKKIPETLPDRKKLLQLLHAVKENDPDSFFAREKWEITALLKFLVNSTGKQIIGEYGEEDSVVRYKTTKIKETREEAKAFLLKTESEKINKNDFFGFLIKITK